MTKSRFSRQRGFSLAECVIAIALFTILATYLATITSYMVRVNGETARLSKIISALEARAGDYHKNADNVARSDENVNISFSSASGETVIISLSETVYTIDENGYKIHIAEYEFE